MKTLQGLLSFLVLVPVLLLISCSGNKKSQELPNIVYILTDDMGYGDVSALNEQAAWKTVNMDRLASEGMVFTDAHSSSAVCTPTRYGILTGRYSWRTRLKTGVLWGRSKPLIEQGRLTVASLLKKHGYETACIGKWHLGLGWQFYPEKKDSINFSKPLTDTPNDHGFDYSYIIPASLDINPYVYIENDHSTTIPTKYTVNKGRYGWWRRGLTGDDFVHRLVLPHLTNRSIDFIRKHLQEHPDKPFFLYFAMPAPHTPIIPTKEFQGKSHTTPYGDYVLEVDAMVGKIMEEVHRDGIEKNTLFIVTSDNGASPACHFDDLAKFGHHPSYVFRGTKSDIWEGGHRIPFIARWPGVVKPGTACSQTICLTDLLATCAAITGDKLPEDAGEDSYNIMAYLQGEKLNEPIRPGTVNHSIAGFFALRKGPWKLEMCKGSGGWSFPQPSVTDTMNLPPVQLYNLDEDISETTNVWHQHSDLVKSMKEQLNKYILEGRSTPGVPQPYVKKDHWPGLGWMEERKNE